MRHGVWLPLLAALLLVSGWSDDEPEPAPQVAVTQTPAPTYDATAQPAAAVLALAPEDVDTIAVTDFDQVQRELGVELTTTSTPEEVAAFWQRADAERPLLTTGLLRPADAQLLATYGFSEVDVAWEAHFSDADGHETGWVLRFHDSTDMTQVEAASHDTAGPLAGGTVDAADHLVTKGATEDPTTSWAADPDVVADLVAGLSEAPANSTYLSRSCVDVGGSDDLDELGTYAVQFQGSLVTARLGPGRSDLFRRMRAGEDQPAFAATYGGGVADPMTGRIGYVMADPAVAAQLALRRELPFAICA